MEYSTFVPNPQLQHFVECYWIVEGSDTVTQKIIPDGSSELVFHFGDRYKVHTEDTPETLQSFSIAAGQLNKPIFLTPTGNSGVLGVKFRPLGMWRLLGCNMDLLTNETFALRDVLDQQTEDLADMIRSVATNQKRIGIVETFLLHRIKRKDPSAIEPLIGEIHQHQGQVSIRELSGKFKVSGRKIERLFLQQVGVPAKLYSRLVRFAHVYRLVQQPELTKAEATYLCGYFDQAHFNKEFREFTGENPESYFSQNHAFSNFFLNR
jgi:AraC-like DNA-binding protein